MSAPLMNSRVQMPMKPAAVAPPILTPTVFFTIPMSKLEAMGLVKPVPIVIDYDLDLEETTFTNVAPMIGPPLPAAPATGTP
jgi:hypothetical protein